MSCEHGRLVRVRVHDRSRGHRKSNGAVLVQSTSRSELLGDFESSTSRQMVEPLPQLDSPIFIFVERLKEVIHKHLVVRDLQILQRALDLVAVQGAARVACVVMFAERANRNLSIRMRNNSESTDAARNRRSAGRPRPGPPAPFLPL